ncbi:MAG: hypothetical protein Q7S31_00265 [bacterium]|nr:hypothetical protein [bacterium]
MSRLDDERTLRQSSQHLYNEMQEDRNRRNMDLGLSAFIGLIAYVGAQEGVSFFIIAPAFTAVALGLVTAVHNHLKAEQIFKGYLKFRDRRKRKK